MAKKKKTGPSKKSLDLMTVCLPILAEHGEGRNNVEELREKLEAAGVKFSQPTGTYQVTGAGITASATAGYGPALRIWAQKARRTLLQAAGV